MWSAAERPCRSRRGELKSNGPTRVGELGRSWKATDRGWRLKIRRLLRCPASTYSQVFRRFLAAICDDVEANLGALCEGGETCPLDRRYMDEDILAAGIRLNETIPLRRIEPLYYPHRHVDFSMLKNQRWCQKFDKRKAARAVRRRLSQMRETTARHRRASGANSDPMASACPPPPMRAQGCCGRTWHAIAHRVPSRHLGRSGLLRCPSTRRV